MIDVNRRWKLRCGGATYIIARRWHVRQDELDCICRYMPGFFNNVVADPFACRTLHDIWAGVDGGLAAGGRRFTPREFGARMLADLERWFRIGQLVLIREKSRLGAGGSSADGLRPKDPAPPPPEEKPAARKKTWIEIVLVDERKQPVPFEAYVVMLPNGFEQRGSLDENGKAYINGFDPGMCNVSFPYLHREEWRPA